MDLVTSHIEIIIMKDGYKKMASSLYRKKEGAIYTFVCCRFGHDIDMEGF